MARENGYLADVERKKLLIRKTIKEIDDKDYFYNGYPQKDCHSQIAKYIIDRSKWRL